jgi:hypothetical protein
MIYIGQTALKLTFEIYELTDGTKTAVDLTGATVVINKISGSPKTFTANISDAENGVVEYEVVDESDINEAGNWRLQPEITFANGKKIKGEPVKFIVQ